MKSRQEKINWAIYQSPGHELVVNTVRVAEQLTKTADRLFSRHGLSMPQFNVLTLLSAHPEGLAQTQLGDLLVVSRANVTMLIRRMEKAGLCTIESQDSDARVKRVLLTTQGKKMLEKLEGVYLQEIDRVTESISPQHAQQFLKVLGVLKERLSRS